MDAVDAAAPTACPAPAARAAAAVTVAALPAAALLLPWRWPPARVREREEASEGHATPLKPRCAAFDNAKFLVQVLVIWDHVLAVSGFSFEGGPYSAVTKAVRFHMPLACLLSGAVSRGALTKDRLLAMLVSNISAGLISPNSWYIKCLTAWRVLSRMLSVLPVLLQWTVVLLLGISSAYSKKELHEMDRVASMLPYFFLGQRLDWDRLCHWRERLCGRRLCISWIVLLGFVGYYILFEQQVDVAVRAVDTYFPTLPWTSMRTLLSPECPEERPYLAARYCAGLVLRGAQALLFFLFCVPHGPSPFSELGAHSVYSFLLHPLPLLAINLPLAIWLRSLEVELWYWRYLQVDGELVITPPALDVRLKGCAWALVHLPYSLAVAWLLSTPRCRAKTSWLVEPWWVVCRRRAREEAKDS